MPIFYKEYLIALERDAKIEEAERRIREFLEKYQNVNQTEMELVLLYREDMPRWAFYAVLKEMEEKGEILREPIYEVTGHEITLLKEEEENGRKNIRNNSRKRTTRHI